AVRNSRPDHAVGKLAPGGHTQPRIVKPGAPALFGPETLVGQRLVDEPVADFRAAIGASLLDRDRDGEMRNSVEEIGRSIERVDDPARLCWIALDRSTFLQQHAPIGPRIAKLLDNRLLGAFVGHGDEVRRPLAADLKLLDLAEVAPEPRR